MAITGLPDKLLDGKLEIVFAGDRSIIDAISDHLETTKEINTRNWIR